MQLLLEEKLISENPVCYAETNNNMRDFVLLVDRRRTWGQWDRAVELGDLGSLGMGDGNGQEWRSTKWKEESLTGCGPGLLARAAAQGLESARAGVWMNPCCRKWQQEKDEGKVCDPGTWLEDVRELLRVWGSEVWKTAELKRKEFCFFREVETVKVGWGSQTVLDDTGGKISHVLVYAF